MVNTFQQLKDDPTLPRAYLVEINPFDPVGAAEVRIGFSDGADIPHYDGFLWEARLVLNFNSTLNLFDNTVGLGSAPFPSFGNVTLAFETDSVQISDGNTIDLTGLEYDGRKITVHMGDPTGAFADFGVLFKGRLEDVTWDDTKFNLILADPGIMFDKVIQETVFAGTGGVEGGSDLKDEVKPLLFGERINIAPILTDAADRIYVIHDSSVNSIDNVFDRGVVLTNAGDITALSLPALENWTPEGGKYVTDLAQGAFRLGATPDGPVTVDAKGDDTATYINKIADIAQRIIENRTDLATADIDTSAVTTFNTDRPGVAGIYIDSQANVQAVLSSLVGQVGGTWYFADDGKWTILVPKFAASQATISEHDIVSIGRRNTANPVWRIKVGYNEMGVVQNETTLDLPSAAISAPFNLFGVNANVRQTGLTFTYYSKKPIVDLDLFVGDLISAGVWLEDPTTNVTNARVRILFFDSSDVQVGSAFEGNFVNTATAFTRTVVEDVTIPATTTSITIDVIADTNGGDVLLERAMFNRGTIALPFVKAVGTEASTILDARTYLHSDRTVGNLVRIPDNANFEMDGDQTLEFEVWFDVVDATSQILISKRDPGGTNVGYTVALDGGSDRLLLIIDEGATQQNLLSDAALVTGRWYHIAIRRTNASNLYEMIIGGTTQAATVTSAVSLVNPGDLLFFNAQLGNFQLSGRLQNVRMWTALKTDAVLIADRFERLEGTEASLAGLWTTDEAVGSLVANKGSVGSAGDGVITNLDAGITWRGPAGDGVATDGPDNSTYLEFTGVAADIVTVPDNVAWEYLVSVDRVIEIEFSLDIFANNATLIGKRQAGDAKGWEIIYATASDVLAFTLDIGASDSAITFPGSDLTLGKRHHVAVVRDTSGLHTMYLDGGPNATTITDNTDIQNTADVTFADLADFARNLDGRIYWARIWDKPRSQAELIADRDVVFPDNTPNLLGDWRFDEGMGKTVFNHGTVANTDGIISGTGFRWGGEVGFGMPALDTLSTDGGNIRSGRTINQGDGTFRAFLIGGSDIFLEDGDSPTYQDNWVDPPLLWPGRGGLTTDASLTGDVNPQIEMQNPTTSGADASFRIVELSGTPILRTETTAGESGVDFSKTKAIAGIAWDDKYTIQYDLTVGKAIGFEDPSWVQIRFFYKDGALGYVLIGTRTHFNFDENNTLVLLNQTKTFIVSGVAQNDDFGISKGTEVGNPSTLDGMDNFTYETATAPADNPATKTTTGDVRLSVLGPDAGGVLP